MEVVLNNTIVDYPKEKSLHGLIAESAAKHPDKIALSFHHTSLTYTELNNTANRLAHELIKRGVKPGDIIGLALDRSAELIISLLAILKTGAAYVPLDPEYPKDRIEFMLDDSAATTLITSTKYKGHFASNTTEVLIEDALTNSANYSNDAPEVQVTGQNLGLRALYFRFYR
jgi:non-ribosomal peptide synthetase component F